MLVRLSKGESYALGVGRHVLGRATDCSVPMPDSKSVSRRHAELEVRAGSCIIRDLSSTNGVFVDGRRLAAGAEANLTAGARFVLGDEEFQLR